MDNKKPKRREDYFRCKYCGNLFATEELVLDPVDGYLCPYDCKEPFYQPPYDSPFIS